MPEVLPRHMLHLAEPNAASLLDALSAAIADARERPCHTHFHDEVARLYSWRDVATRTAAVYDAIRRRPRRSRCRATRAAGCPSST